jgi:hypothetical protein
VAQRTMQKRRHFDDDDNSDVRSSEPAHSIPSTASLPVHHESMSTDLPAPLRGFLLDVFFLHMWNASLIFHRASFLHALERNAVPQHNLLAIYATATMCASEPFARHYAERSQLPPPELELCQVQCFLASSLRRHPDYWSTMGY